MNVLAPGCRDTARLRSQFDDDAGALLDDIGAGIRVGRVGAPDDFGAVVAFFAGREAGFVTGACLLVDGGAPRGI